MRRSVQLFSLGVLAIIVIGLGMSFYANKHARALDVFAQCLTARGAILYGSMTSQHTDNTKALFGASARLLPYVECTASNGTDKLQQCGNVGVVSYPTWVFANGITLKGEHTLKEIAQESGCTLAL